MERSEFPEEVSISRQHEMKQAHDSQQQFHSLLKEYMGNYSFITY